MEETGYGPTESDRARGPEDEPAGVRPRRHGTGDGTRAGRRQGAAAGVRGWLDRAPRRRHQRGLHRAEDLGWLGRGADFSAGLTLDRGVRAPPERIRVA